MNPIFTELATLETILDDNVAVVYGGNMLTISGGLTIRQVIQSMSDIFPELYNGTWQLDIANNRLHVHPRPIQVRGRKSIWDDDEGPEIDVDINWKSFKKTYVDIKNNAEGLRLLRKGDAFEYKTEKD